jgi:hypothetical protein
MAEVEKRNCPRGGAARHCTERADKPYMARPVLLFGQHTTMLSHCEQMYTMVLGCNSTMGAGGKGSRHCREELHTAACNRPAHPTLVCVCLGRVIHIDAKLLLQDQTKLSVLLFSVGVLLFCQPSVHHQSMSNVCSLICCVCTLSVCSPLLTVRTCHLHTDI